MCFGGFYRNNTLLEQGSLNYKQIVRGIIIFIFHLILFHFHFSIYFRNKTECVDNV